MPLPFHFRLITRSFPKCAYCLLCIPNKSGSGTRGIVGRFNGISRFYCDLDNCSLAHHHGASVFPESHDQKSIRSSDLSQSCYHYECQEGEVGLFIISFGLFLAAMPTHSIASLRANPRETEAMIKGKIGSARPRDMNKKLLV